MVPSDWEAYNTHGATNPATLADWKAALDATVIKQGVFTWIFHPHGWSTPAQIVDFNDHAERNHGKQVKCLTFKEALERLNKNLLKGETLREARGDDNGVRLLDLNNDGFMDVVIGRTFRPTGISPIQFGPPRPSTHITRSWHPAISQWNDSELPFTIVEHDAGLRLAHLAVVSPVGWI